MDDDELTWRKLGSSYSDDDLILFRTRFDEMENPRNGLVANLKKHFVDSYNSSKVFRQIAE